MSKQNGVDCYDYVRTYYSVPAYIGVKVSRGEWSGVIVPAKSNLHYVHVQLDGQKHSTIFHPQELTYTIVGQAGAQE